MFTSWWIAVSPLCDDGLRFNRHLPANRLGYMVLKNYFFKPLFQNVQKVFLGKT